MLLIFAWSSVGFNLHEVYRPVMGLLFEMPAEEVPTAAPPTSTREPMGWFAAQATANRLMREQGRLHGFSVISPDSLYHLAAVRQAQPVSASPHQRFNPPVPPAVEIPPPGVIGQKVQAILGPFGLRTDSSQRQTADETIPGQQFWEN